MGCKVRYHPHVVLYVVQTQPQSASEYSRKGVCKQNTCRNATLFRCIGVVSNKFIIFAPKIKNHADTSR